MERKITVDADYGDEIVIQCGKRELRVAVDAETLLPDFVGAVIQAIGYDARLMLNIVDSAYHNTHDARHYAERVLSGLRDKFFADIRANAKSTANKPEQTTAPTVEEPAPAEIEQTPKKKSKRG